MLIDALLTAIDNYRHALELLEEEHPDQIQEEMIQRHLGEAKAQLQEALDSYIDARLERRSERLADA